jgi:hypothetical protein
VGGPQVGRGGGRAGAGREGIAGECAEGCHGGEDEGGAAPAVGRRRGGAADDVVDLGGARARTCAFTGLDGADAAHGLRPAGVDGARPLMAARWTAPA